MVSLLYSICRGTRVKDDGLPGLRVALTNHHFPCGCSRHQSKGHSASIWIYLIFDLLPGGDNFPCQVSQTCRAIQGAVGFRKKHRSLRRGGMEKVPDDYCSSLLGGTYRTWKLSFSQYDFQRNTRLVWDETIRIIFDLFDNVWGDRPEIVSDHCIDITLPVGQV